MIKIDNLQKDKLYKVTFSFERYTGVYDSSGFNVQGRFKKWEIIITDSYVTID